MALQRLHADPAWEVVGLLTTVNRQHERIAMHGIRRSVLEAQAEALNLPVIVAEMDWPGRERSVPGELAACSGPDSSALAPTGPMRVWRHPSG